eukprot:6485624-Amphidinium_carterae.1
MEVDETGGNPHMSPPPSPPHPATEVPEGEEGEQADFDVEAEEDPHHHQVGTGEDDHPWGPPLAEADEDEVEDDDLTLTLGVGDDAEVPLDHLTLQEAPTALTSKRDISQ